MSLFVCTIYENEESWAAADEATSNQIMEGHRAFGTKYGDRIKGGEALQPAASAKTIRSGSVTDGPFLETKEVLGGFYVVEADSMDAAVEIAKEIPAEFGCVEVREVMVFN
jgi:hypothetical protein